MIVLAYNSTFNSSCLFHRLYNRQFLSFPDPSSRTHPSAVCTGEESKYFQDCSLAQTLPTSISISSHSSAGLDSFQLEDCPIQPPIPHGHSVPADLQYAQSLGHYTLSSSCPPKPGNRLCSIGMLIKNHCMNALYYSLNNICPIVFTKKQKGIYHSSINAKCPLNSDSADNPRMLTKEHEHLKAGSIASPPESMC